MKLINELNPEKTKTLVKKAIAEKEKLIVIQAQNDEYNRKMLEYGRFDVLLSPESGQPRKDKLRQADSGFNHVLAKIAAKNKISIGIDLNEIERLEKKEKARRISRIVQNIQICRRAGCKITLLTYKDKKDASSFLTSLGASSQQAKEALDF